MYDIACVTPFTVFDLSTSFSYLRIVSFPFSYILQNVKETNQKLILTQLKIEKRKYTHFFVTIFWPLVNTVDVDVRLVAPFPIPAPLNVEIDETEENWAGSAWKKSFIIETFVNGCINNDEIALFCLCGWRWPPFMSEMITRKKCNWNNLKNLGKNMFYKRFNFLFVHA